VGGGAATVELTYQIAGDRRRRTSLKPQGFVSDWPECFCLVANYLPAPFDRRSFPAEEWGCRESALRAAEVRLEEAPQPSPRTPFRANFRMADPGDVDLRFFD
jgi:hypothetical protein